MTTQSKSNVFRHGYLPVLSGAVCISFAAFFVRGSPIDPSAVAFYRLLLGGAALFLVAAVRGMLVVPGRATGRLIFMAGMFFSVDLLFWHASIVIVGPGIATILTNFQVIFLAFYDALLLKNPISGRQYLAIPTALIGLALLLGLHEKSLPPGIALGLVFGLLSALFYSFYVLTLRKTQSIPERLPPVANIAWVSLAGALCVGLYCVAGNIPLAIPSAKSFAAVASLGIFCQSLGWLLLSLGLPHLTPFRAGLLMLLQPMLSYIWDIVLFGALAEPVNILGACLAIAAIGMGIFAPGKNKIATTPGKDAEAE